MLNVLNTIPRLVDVLMNDFQPDVKDMNLTQQKVLLVVAKSEQVTMTFLSRMLAMEKGSMTSVVDKLIRMGYLARKRNPDDRRQVLIQLTQNGQAAAEKLGMELDGHLKQKFNTLNEAEQTAFTNAIDTLQMVIEKIEQRN
jgi:DNA-binding MarR family transcriptional regulator